MTARPVRLNRSQLSVPGHSDRMLEKAAASAADVVILDLEDSVAPADKPAARARVIEAISSLGWGTKSVSVRVNGLDTPFFYRDVIDILEQAGPRLDLLMVPKVSSAADVHGVDLLVGQVEMAMARTKPVGLELQIETAQGMVAMEAIAAASPRSESLHFGSGDYAASIQARTTTIGGLNSDYGVLADADAGGARAFFPGDVWHFALSRLIVTARAFGLRPLDGPYADFRDEAGFIAHARRVAALGAEGKWCIHPSQIPLANQVFSPTEEEVGQAKAILEALKSAEAEGLGAVVLDGRMIDIASIRQAEMMVAKHAMIVGA